MRKQFLILILLGLVCTAQAEPVLWPSKATLVSSVPSTVKVLSINNSLIDYNDQYAMFNDIAAAMGRTATWTKHTNLGKQLDYHFNSDPLVPNAKTVVASDVWTHIILQEQSSLPRTNFTTFRNNVKMWVEYIRAKCLNPHAVIILPINWAYSDDANFETNNATLIANYRKVAQEFGLVLCPAANAYGDYKSENVSTFVADLYTDNRHPTQAASYLACCMEVAVIFDIDPTTITWKPGALSDEMATKMRQYAKKACDNFTQVVDHHAQKVRYEVHEVDANGLSIGKLQDAGEETYTINGTYQVTRTYNEQSLESTVTRADAVTTKPAPEPTPAISIAALTPYTQDFNSIGGEDVDPSGQEKTAFVRESTLPQGWRIERKLSEPRVVGEFLYASPTTMYIGGQGLASNAKNGTWNFGATGSTDRAIGGLTTDAADGTRAVNVMAHMHNDAGVDIKSIELSYDIEKYRDGANAQGFTVQLYTSTDGTAWTAAGDPFTTSFPKDAVTKGYDVVPVSVTPVSGTLDVSFPVDGDLFLAWHIVVSSGTSYQAAQALAIDNVSITPVCSYDTTETGSITADIKQHTKIIRDGQLFIMRGEEVYNLYGTRIQ